MQVVSGFSLFEILITLFLAAVIAAFAIPSFETFSQKSQQKTESQELFRAINFARSEAIILGSTVTLCQSENQFTCSGDWQSGFIVSNNEHVLFSFKNNKNQNKLHWRAFPYFLDHLEFLSSGFPNFQNGTFWLCPLNAKNPVWAIMMSQSGRARMVYPDASGVIDDDKGDALEC